MDSHRRQGTIISRRGIALLMVVACIFLVTIAAVGVSRRSLLLALDGVDAADQLQARWGRLSLERSALAAAITMYGGDPPAPGPAPENPIAEDETPEPPAAWEPIYELQIRIADDDYTIVMADESAKANLNKVIQLESPEAARSLAGRLGGQALGRLRLPEPNGARPERVAIRSWGEVLPIGTTGREALALEELAASTDQLTIWGDGRVNLLRAPDEVVFALSRLIVSDGQSRDWIREFRDSFPEQSPTMIFRELGFEIQEEKALLNLISLRSTLLSVWVLSDSPAIGQSHSLAARTGSDLWETRTIRYTR